MARLASRAHKLRRASHSSSGYSRGKIRIKTVAAYLCLFFAGLIRLKK